MLLFYLPVVFVTYGFLALLVISAGTLRFGDISVMRFDVAVFLFGAMTLVTLVFWAAGYAVRRFHVYSSRYDREIVLDILKRASDSASGGNATARHC
jgi:hypothetical protein